MLQVVVHSMFPCADHLRVTGQQATGKHQAHRDTFALAYRSPLFPTVRGVPVEVCNRGGALRHGYFSPRLQLRQKSGCGFSKRLRFLSGAGAVHDGNHEGATLKCPTRALKELTK